MRTLSQTLLIEQKKATRKPVVKVEVQAFGHPQKSADIQWGTFGWKRLYQGSEAKSFHGAAIAGDGSLLRIRLDGTDIKYSRVTSPDEDSTYSSWITLGTTVANSHIAIAARGTEVIVVASTAANLKRIQSSDYGASWGSWTTMTNTRPCEQGCSIAFKFDSNDCAIVHASDVDDTASMYIQTRTSGAWSSGLGQRAGEFDIEGLAMYYDGDWNVIQLQVIGNYLTLVRAVYGDGDQVPAGTWTADECMGLAAAKLDLDALLPIKDPDQLYFARHAAVLEALAGENLDISTPFVVLE